MKLFRSRRCMLVAPRTKIKST